MNQIAAIWARVSTAEQTSLPDQIARVKARLEKEGYQVPPERVLAVDWTSLDLFSCSQFQQLISWVRRREIQGLGILDRDRLQAEGMQRLTFLTECKESGVQLVICQGPPLMDGDEGQLIELALTIGKKRSVLRARQGAKDGLHDKVVRDRKPISHHKIFGYEWEGDLRLKPDHNLSTVKLILDMAVQGATLFAIQRELKNRGVLTPRGIPVWDRSSIHQTIINPVYAGRYYALKNASIEPKRRRGNTYGNTSVRCIPLEDAVYLPEVEVLAPPITWEQYELSQERRKKNRELARRNAKHDYLLRGLIFCETHRGRNGQPRRYWSKPHANGWQYKCPVGGCSHSYLNGHEIEDWAKLSTWNLLNQQPYEFYLNVANLHASSYTQESLTKEIRDLEARYNRNINAETELESRNLLGQEEPEVYRRLKVQFQAQRDWITERKKAIAKEMAQLEYHAPALAILGEIRERFAGRLYDELNDEEWRSLFIELNMEIHIRDRNNPATWRDPQADKTEDVREMDIHWGLPLKAETTADIVFTNPPSLKLCQLLFVIPAKAGIQACRVGCTHPTLLLQCRAKE